MKSDPEKAIDALRVGSPKVTETRPFADVLERAAQGTEPRRSPRLLVALLLIAVAGVSSAATWVVVDDKVRFEYIDPDGRRHVYRARRDLIGDRQEMIFEAEDGTHLIFKRVRK